MRRIISTLLLVVMMIGILPMSVFASDQAFVSFRINDDVLQDHIPQDRFKPYKVYVDGEFFNTFDNPFRFDYGMADVGRILHIRVEMEGYAEYKVDYQVKPDPGTGLENDFLIFLKRLGDDASASKGTIVRTIDENTRTVSIGEMGLQIDLPNYVVDGPTELVVKKVENSHNKGMPETLVSKEVIDVSLGDRHELTGFATIIMSYDQANIPSGISEDTYVSAMYLNQESNLWESIYYEVDVTNNKLYIKTDHLSIFALLFGERNESRPKTVNVETFSVQDQTDSDLVTALKFLDKSIKSFSDYKVVEAAEFITNTDALKNLNKGLSGYGKGKKVFAIHEGIWATGKQTPEAKKAVLDAAKAIFDYGMDELMSLPAAASVGVTIIDYALTEFIDAAFEGNEKVYYTAYTDFYNTAKGPGVKSITEWIGVIEPMIDPKNPQDLSRKLDEYVADYLNEIWDSGDNEGWFDDQVHSYGKDFAYQSLLTPAMKVKLANQFKPTLYNTRIVPALTQIREKQMEAAEQALDDMYWDLEMHLVLPNGVRVDFKEPSGKEGTYKLEGVKISLLGKNNEVIKNTPQNIKYRTNAKEVRFTLLELLEANTNVRAVRVEMPLHDGNYKIENITLPFNPFEVEFGEVSVMLPDDYVEFEKVEEASVTQPTATDTNTKDMKTTTFVFKDADSKEQMTSNISFTVNGTSYTAYKGKRILTFDANESKDYSLKFSTDGYDPHALSLNTTELKQYANKNYEVYLQAAEEASENGTSQSDTGLYHNICVGIKYKYDAVTSDYPDTATITLNGKVYTNVDLDQYGRAIFNIPRTPGPWHKDPVNVEVTVPGAEPATKTYSNNTSSMGAGTYMTDEGEISVYPVIFDFYIPNGNR
jgi:hypothetical protein